LVYRTAILHDHKVRNAHHAKSLGELGPSFGVDFQHDCSSSHRCSGLLYFRRGHAARAAPRCPEIDQDRNPCFRSDLFKCRWIGVNGFRKRRQGCLAGSAASGIRHVLCRNSILFSTARALANHKDSIARPDSGRQPAIG